MITPSTPDECVVQLDRIEIRLPGESLDSFTLQSISNFTVPLLPGAGLGGQCSELLQVHISEEMEDPLTGINRRFGQLRDLPTLTFVNVNCEEAL